METLDYSQFVIEGDYMEISYDSQVHATYVKLTSKKIIKTVQQGKYYIDLAEDGSIVGVEYLSTPDLKGLTIE